MVVVFLTVLVCGESAVGSDAVFGGSVLLLILLTFSVGNSGAVDLAGFWWE